MGKKKTDGNGTGSTAVKEAPSTVEGLEIEFKVEIEADPSSDGILFNPMGEEEIQNLKSPAKRQRKYEDDRVVAARKVPHQGGLIILPRAMLIACIKKAGQLVQYQGNRKFSNAAGETLVTGPMAIQERYIPLLDKDGNEMKMPEIDDNGMPVGETPWTAFGQVATNEKVGAVYTVRPLFVDWKARFTLRILPEFVLPDKARTLIRYAGTMKGIGSFRVERGGTYGKFRISQWEENGYV